MNARRCLCGHRLTSVAPLMWCAESYAARRRWQWRTVVGIAATLILFAWIALCYINNSRFKRVEADLPTATEEELSDYYQAVRDWTSFWSSFRLTPFQSPADLRETILTTAEDRLHKNIDPRKDKEGNLRTTDDWRVSREEIDKYCQRYAGTENARRLEEWVNTQRRIQAQRLVDRLRSAATGANERLFDELLRDYQSTALPYFDAQIDEARKILNSRIVAEQVKELWKGLTIEPQNIDKMRELCKTAEELIAQRPSHRPKDEEFVQLVRRTYDQLKQSNKATISFHIETENNQAVDWQFRLDGVDKATSGGWRDPVKASKTGFRIEGDKVGVDLLHADAKVEILIKVYDWNYAPWSWWESRGELRNVTLAGLSQLTTPAVVTTNSKKEYRVLFNADEYLVEHCSGEADQGVGR